MKKVALMIIGIFSIGLMSMKNKTSVLNEESKGVHFQNGSFQSALNLAKKENKIIFLDVYASWCGPCKMLKRNTFSDEKVGAFYNQNFINFAADGEVGEGVTLAQKYRVKAYPTLLFIKPDGTVHTATSGYHTPSQFIDLGMQVLNK